jgi:transcriptional regulator with XRE-family HTH domain
VTARERLAARRKVVGLSQEDLGEVLGVHPQTVAAWEQGRATPRPWYRTLLAEALRVEMEELEHLLATETSVGTPRGAPVMSMATEWDRTSAARLADATAGEERSLVGVDAAVRLVHEWLVVEPPQSVEMGAGRRVGARLAAATAERVDRLRHLDDYLAGADLEAAVGRELVVTSAVVRDASYSDQVGTQLLGSLGDLCQLAGWVAVDAGCDRRACHLYAIGLSAAHAAGDAPLAGQLVSSLAYLLASQSRSADAVLLAESALAGSRSEATATTRALFLERVAWAHARMGARGATERALGGVEEAFGRRTPSDDPPWTYWLTPEEIDVMAGRCYVELGLPLRAIPILERSVAAYDEERPREAALYMSWLAEAHLQSGDVEQAAAQAGHVLDLTHRTASARTVARVRHLCSVLRPHRGVPEVSEFLERARARAE